jgi:serine/threonine kinase 16
MLRLFRGTCLAVRAMHEYRPTTPRSAAEAAAAVGATSAPTVTTSQRHDDEDDERFPQAEGDAEGGYSYDGASVPLVTRHRVDEGDVIFDGDEELEHVKEELGKSGAEVVPYAHRDLKPGYGFSTLHGRCVI